MTLGETIAYCLLFPFNAWVWFHNVWIMIHL